MTRFLSLTGLGLKLFLSSNILSPFTYVICISFSLHLVLLILTFFIVFIVLFTRLPFYDFNYITSFFFLANQFYQFLTFNFSSLPYSLIPFPFPDFSTHLLVSNKVLFLHVLPSCFSSYPSSFSGY